MPSQDQSQLPETAIMVNSVETVFRKLIRLLVGRISLVRVQEMIRYIYIEEAEKSLKADYPGKNVPLTKLALVTGLDTRTVIQIRKEMNKRSVEYPERYLSELTPESAIIEAWVEKVKHSKDKKKSSTLTYGHVNAEFEQLVKSTIPTRGITTQSILQRLLDTKSITRDECSKKIQLIVDHYSPYFSEDEPSKLNAALVSISSLVSTIEHNLSGVNKEKFYQRQFWTSRLSPKNQEKFRNQMFRMLTKYQAISRKEIEHLENKNYGADLITAGVGFYYFEDVKDQTTSVKS